MELNHNPVAEQGSVAPGFNAELYLDLVTEMSDGQVSSIPSGGIQLIDRYSILARHTGGSFDIDHERIRLRTRNITSLWKAGEVLAHETCHYIDWRNKYPGIENSPPYAPISLALTAGRWSAALYGATSLGKAVLDEFGVDINQLPSASLAQIIAYSTIGLATMPAQHKVFQAYRSNPIERRARSAESRWGRYMQEVLAETAFWQ